MNKYTCSVCGKEIYAAIPMYFSADGKVLCSDCIRRLPKSLRRSVKALNAADIRRLNSMITPAEVPSRCRSRMGTLYNCGDSIILNYYRYPMKEIMSMDFHFVPMKRISEDSALAYMYVVIELREPHILIQEPILTEPRRFSCALERRRMQCIGNDVIMSIIHDYEISIEKMNQQFKREVMINKY